MRNTTWLTCMAALSGLLLVACDDGNGGGDDAGGTHMDGGHTGVDGGGGDEDAGPGTDGGGSEDGGGGGGDCATNASAYCARFMECNPNGFTGAFESMDICVRVRTASCENETPLAGTNGLMDEAACEAAQVANCDGFLAAGGPPVLEACLPAPGDVTTAQVENSCFSDAQCGVDDNTGRRMWCRPLNTSSGYTTGTADCPRGQCVAVKPVDSSSCNPANERLTELCDYFSGQSCVQQFDGDTGVTGSNTCMTVTYGTNGDDCFPGSDMQCASGFECDTGTKTCMAALAEGQSCDLTNDLCDGRLGLSCTNEGTGGNHCRVGIVFVHVGADCGPAVPVGSRTENHQCSQYATTCDLTDTDPACVARVPEGSTCTVSPDNCEPGLECDDTTNTCQVPEPTTCP